MFTSADEVLDYIRKNDVQFVDVRFCDLPGIMQHFTFPVENFTETVFTDGLMFDGSSIRGFQAIHESDMLLLPDPTTAFVDPFRQHQTLVMNFFIHDPLTGEAYTRDPRNIAKKAETYLAGTGIADTTFFGPEAEFYIFDDIRYDYQPNGSLHQIDSIEAAWNTARNEGGSNLGYKPRYKGGYFPVPPTDHFTDLRSEMVRVLIDAGIDVEMQHHEVGTAGQAEIDFRYNTLLKTADNLMVFKYVVRNVAHRNNRTVTFMPKPLFGDNGSGMHCHQSLWKDGQPLFYDEIGYARPVRPGPLLHRRAAQARPVAAGLHEPDDELLPPAGARLRGAGQSRVLAAQPLGLLPHPDHRPVAEGQAHRVARARPELQPVPRLRRDADGGPRRHPQQDRAARSRWTRTSTSCPPTSSPQCPQVPGSLEKVLDALEADHDFLLEGGVFTSDVVETWVDYKREHEVDPIRLRPHPYEFALYYDI